MKRKKSEKNSSKMKVTVIKGPQFEERKKEAVRMIIHRVLKNRKEEGES